MPSQTRTSCTAVNRQYTIIYPSHWNSYTCKYKCNTVQNSKESWLCEFKFKHMWFSNENSEFQLGLKTEEDLRIKTSHSHFKSMLRSMLANSFGVVFYLLYQVHVWTWNISSTLFTQQNVSQLLITISKTTELIHTSRSTHQSDIFLQSFFQVSHFDIT